MRRGRIAALMVLTPLLAGGCGASGAAPAAAPTSGFPWIVTVTGSATPSPSPSVSYSSPAPFPSGFLPIGSAQPSPTPTGSSCGETTSQNSPINGATAVAATTSAVVTWHNPGGADLVEYRVTAISQNLVTGAQRDVGWTVITPSGCGFMSATVTGLDRKTDYQFSVDAVTKLRGLDGTHASTVARSPVTRTR